MTSPAQLYQRLMQTYGPQGWWPAEDAFEVIAGAVLVQRTAWRNAELAIDNLRRDRLLSPQAVAGLSTAELARLIRPAGFWRIKSERLHSVARAIASVGGIAPLTGLGTDELRNFLLGIHGVGEETADAILLYAFGRPVVVVDAYLRRLMSRVNGEPAASRRGGDRALRTVIARSLTTADELNEWHALVVEHGKAQCRVRPSCEGCCLRAACRTGSGAGRFLS